MTKRSRKMMMRTMTRKKRKTKKKRTCINTQAQIKLYQNHQDLKSKSMMRKSRRQYTNFFHSHKT